MELFNRQWQIHAKHPCDLTWVYEIQTLTLNWFLKTPPTAVMWDDFEEQDSGKGRKKREWRREPNFQIIFFSLKSPWFKNLVYNTGQDYNSADTV